MFYTLTFALQWDKKENPKRKNEFKDLKLIKNY